METQEQSNVRRSWSLPHPKKITKALKYFQKRPQKPIILTPTFKLHNLSKRRTRLLIEAHAYITNLEALILEQWRESPNVQSQDKVVAKIFKLQADGINKRSRSGALSTAIYDEFEPVLIELGGKYPGRLRQGAYRECARTLVGWTQKLSNLITKDKPKGFVLTPTLFYEEWAKLEQQYQQAIETIAALSFNPDQVSTLKPHELERKSRREARWLLERLQPEEKIQQMLTYVTAILSEEPSALQRSAAFEEHLWQTGTRRQRRNRESWFLQRVFDPDQHKVILGQMERSELENFYNELQEMLIYIEGIKNSIDVSYNDSDEEDSKESVQSSLDSQQIPVVQKTPIRKLIETFLQNKPMGYPQVQRVWVYEDPSTHTTKVYPLLDEGTSNSVTLLANESIGESIHLDTPSLSTDEINKRLYPEGYGEVEEIYNRRIGWFQLKTDKQNDAERFLSMDIESQEVQGMFHALRMATPAKLQPLNFVGTAYPAGYRKTKQDAGYQKGQAQYRDFALLYDPKTKDIVLAAFIDLFRSRQITDVEQEDQQRRQAQIEAYQRRRIENPLYFVNYPETPFLPSDRSPVLFFALEYGTHYHIKQFIDKLIEKRRVAQHQLYQFLNPSEKETIPIGQCLPEDPPSQSAKISCVWTDDELPEFYLQAPIRLPPPEKQPLPVRVLGICAHDGKYAFAVLSFDGTVEKVGDIFVPKFLDPEQGAKRSDNYIYHIANTIVSKAWAWEAYIGIEDASWKKEGASVSRAINRRIFSMPLQRIITVLKTKAEQGGIMEPRLVSGVSPAYDCAECQTTLKKGSRSPLYNEWVITCPGCRAQQNLNTEQLEQQCASCKLRWEAKEPQFRLEQFFACPRCRAAPRLARHNNAIVVAQKTLVDVVEHHKNSLLQRRLRQNNKSAET